ncbi:ABC transporter permease, partial [Akkermansiaceae bacterium]|nr:ABC transporter permease [Akkermansiaceae bacterium]
MQLLRLALLNLRRHFVRTLIGAAGITFGVVAMLCVVTILQGAVRMFERILSSDSEIIIFEKNVSDLFFSNVSIQAIDDLAKNDLVAEIEPALFGIVSSPDNPVVTCFGIRSDSSRLTNATWLEGEAANFTDAGTSVVLGKRAADFLKAETGGVIPVGHKEFKVAGIIETENGFENGGVFMPLALCQDYFHK